MVHDDHHRLRALVRPRRCAGEPAAGRPADHHPARQAGGPAGRPDLARRPGRPRRRAARGRRGGRPGGRTTGPGRPAAPCRRQRGGVRPRAVGLRAHPLLPPAVQLRRGCAGRHAGRLVDAAGRPGRSRPPRRRGPSRDQRRGGGVRGVVPLLPGQAPAEAKRYRSAMESTVESFTAGARAYDFSRFDTVVDVGGGLGGLLVAVLREHPGVRGVLLDLPRVVAAAPAVLAEHPEADRIEVVAGDMFHDLPHGADAYVYSTVLRCFEDDACLEALRAWPAPLGPGGQVLAVEMVLPEGVPPSPVRARRRLRHGGLRRQGPHRGPVGRPDDQRRLRASRRSTRSRGRSSWWPRPSPSRRPDDDLPARPLRGDRAAAARSPGSGSRPGAAARPEWATARGPASSTSAAGRWGGCGCCPAGSAPRAPAPAPTWPPACSRHAPGLVAAEERSRNVHPASRTTSSTAGCRRQPSTWSTPGSSSPRWAAQPSS